MKYLLIIIILILAVPCFAASITYDPNEIVVDPNGVTFTVTVTVPLEQYKAMQHLDISIIDIFKQSRFVRILDRLITKAKLAIIENYEIDEAKAKLER